MIKTKSGWHRFFYDLHVSGGFYATLLLLALALTGLTWSFGWYRDAFYTIFGVETTQPQAHAPAPSDSKGKSKEKGSHERGRNKHAETDYTQWAFDTANGKIKEVQLYEDLPKSGKIRGWIYSVHAGTWGGLTTKILSCLVSLLGAVFAITGYYFWIKKKLRKKK